MSIPLHVSVADTHVTRKVSGLAPSRNIHGAAECGFKVSLPLDTDINAFAKVVVYDGRTADVMWDGSLEDPGRTVDADGPTWDMSAIGEYARTLDRAAALIYIDGDPSRWGREQLARATSAEASVSEVPSIEGTDGLLMQYNPGQPIDKSCAIVMVYRAIEEAGMEIGGIEYTTVAGLNAASTSFEARMFATELGVIGGTQIRANDWSTTPASRYATLSDTTPLPAGTTAIQLIAKRTGAATNVIADNRWLAFYDVVVKAARYDSAGVLVTANADYLAGRGVYAHEVVADLLGRGLLPSYDGANATIDASSAYEIDQLAYPDGVSPGKLFEDLMALEPAFFPTVGTADQATGRSSFAWVKWATHARYEVSLRDGVHLPGADAERYNRVTVRWLQKKGDRQVVRTSVYEADGVFAPVVPELETAGPGGTRMVREPDAPIDLSDEIGSRANADKLALEFLLNAANPPVSGTLTIGRRVYDADEGRYVDPWEIEAGHLIRVRELATDVDDLVENGRDGKCVFRIVNAPYNSTENTVTLELDAPPRTDTNELARQLAERDRKR